MKKILASFTLLLGIFVNAQQTSENQFNTEEKSSKENFFTKDMDYELRTHFSIGGSAPLVMPREVRKIVHYNPTLILGVEGNATKWVSANKKVGVRLGVSVESKGMKTSAQVKNYYTEVAQSNQKIKGYFTGMVDTNVMNTYVTMPISAVYRLSEKWNLYGGFFFSGLIDKGFKGKVYDGYLRQDTPVGNKIVFEEEGSAEYDFSDEVQSFQWGQFIGGEWYPRKNFLLFAQLNYGVNSLLNPDFEAITFKLQNIYLNMGFGYRF